MTTTVSVDAFGGDHAPYEIVKGAVEALEEHKSLRVILVGKEREIRSILRGIKYDEKRILVKDAPEVVGMGEKPTVSLRKKNSSMFIGIKLVKDKIAHAFVTAGNSGAAMAISVFVLGRLKGVTRPAIATLLPSLKGEVLMIDAGANVDVKPASLVEFGIMGGVYVKYMRNIERPRIGILSNGGEPGKGSHAVVEAYKIFSKSKVNFVGNIEGDEIYIDKADVVVCDGFIGNIVLKASESIPKIVIEFLRGEIKRSFLYKLGFLLAKPAFRLLKKRIDYSEFGGAPLLGIDGACIISHGRSRSSAIKNAIMKAVSFSKLKINDKIESALASWSAIQKGKIYGG